MNLYLRLLALVVQILLDRKPAARNESCLQFRVLPLDCDVNLHMNNGRYLTFMDLGRVHLLHNLRALGPILKRRWSPVLGAADMSYVRPLRPFQKFKLMTRIVYWDAKYFYIEQRFETNGKLYASAMIRGLFLTGSQKVSTEAVLALSPAGLSRGEMPELIKCWNAVLALKKDAPF